MLRRFLLLVLVATGCYSSHAERDGLAGDVPEPRDRPPDADVVAETPSGVDADAERDTRDAPEAEARTDAGEDCTFMRLRSLRFTAPDVLTNLLLDNLLNDSLNVEPPVFVWLIQLQSADGSTLRLRTGTGILVPGAIPTFRFAAPDYPPGDGLVRTAECSFEPTGDPIPRIAIAVWEEGAASPDPPWLVLPLREVEVGGTFNAEQPGIGTYDAATGAWSDGGTIVGKIAVADARSTVIDVLGMTLCGLLSRDDGVAGNPADDCASDPADWDYPPDTTAGTEPAWSATATYAASAVQIVEP